MLVDPESLSICRQGSTLQVTLMRPDKANALSVAMVEALHAVFDQADADDTSVLAIKGQGRNFCAGFDLSDLSTCSDGDLVLRFIRIEQLLQRIYHAPFTTLAFAQGKAYGAGADLFCACDWRIAEESTEFRFPGPLFGLVLGTGRLAARVGQDQALGLLAAARPMPGDSALRCGLVNELAPRSTWPDVLDRLPGRKVEKRVVADLRARITPDSRAADMLALVESAAVPGLQGRLIDYHAQITRKAQA